MKKQVFFVHGGDAFSKHSDFLQYLRTKPLRDLPTGQAGEHWTKTFSADLGEKYEVFMPSMPNKQNAQYEEWCIWFLRYQSYLRDGVVLVGWSLGGMFLAKYLSKHNLPFIPAKIILLAAPCKTCIGTEGNDCGTFQFEQICLENLAKSDIPIEIWHSEDDFVVPFAAAEEYAQALPKAKAVYFKDKNHFLLDTFPELLKAIGHESRE